MPGMKITLNAAMRARDVSRPRPEQEAAAEQAANDQPSARPRPPRPEPSDRHRRPPRRYGPAACGIAIVSAACASSACSIPGRRARTAASHGRAAKEHGGAATNTAQPAPAEQRKARRSSQRGAVEQGKTARKPKVFGQNGDAGRGKSGGRGKRHRTRRRSGR